MKHEMLKPYTGNSLIFYPGIQEYLDMKYPGAVTKTPRTSTGEYKLKLILEYLSTKKILVVKKLQWLNIKTPNQLQN